jgi:hypothetical protein
MQSQVKTLESDCIEFKQHPIILTDGPRRRFDTRGCYAFAKECERFNQIFFVSNHFFNLKF